MVKVKLSFPSSPAVKREALEKNQAAISTLTPQALGDKKGQHATYPSQGGGGGMLLPSQTLAAWVWTPALSQRHMQLHM